MSVLYLEIIAFSVFISLALLIVWLIHWKADQAAIDLVHELLLNPQRRFGLSQNQRRKLHYYQSGEQLAILAIVIMLWLAVSQFVLIGAVSCLENMDIYVLVLTGCLALRWHFSWQLHRSLAFNYGRFLRAAKMYDAENELKRK